MDLNQTPRRKRILGLSIGVVALAALLAVVVTVQQRQISADTAADIELDTNFGDFTDVLVKVVGKDGQPRQAFVDALVDLNGNCTIDTDETDGVTGEAGDDGTAVLSLTNEQTFIIKAEDVNSAGTGTVGVAVGPTINAESCMKLVREANTDPIVVTLDN